MPTFHRLITVSASLVLCAACGSKITGTTSTSSSSGAGTGGSTAQSSSSGTGTGGGTAQSSSSTSASSSSSGTTSTSSSSGAGGGCSAGGGCQTSADCSGMPCAPITPCGYAVCLQPIAEATTCQMMAPPNQCCTTADCPAGAGCYPEASLGFCGGALPDYNKCIADLCTTDADCAGTGGTPICAPAGAFGFPKRRCYAAYCHRDADCVAHPGGVCAPVGGNTCCSLVLPDGLACVYPGGCGPGAPCPNEGTCDIDTTTGTSACGPKMMGCPP